MLATASSLKTPQPVNVPVTINGKIEKPGVDQRFKFHATKGQKLVIEVQARRFGSEFDSDIQVLTADA